MHFDWKLWALTRGLRGRIAESAALGLLALAVGIARFAFLGAFIAGVFRRTGWEALALPLLATAGAVLLRAWLDHARTMIAHRTAGLVQERLRLALFDKIVALGPAWFGAERTGGVMLSMVDGVEQLQAFFGQYLPQVTIALCAPVAIFAFIAWWDVPVAGVMLAATLFTLVLPASVHRRTARASRERQAAFKSFGEEFLDAVQGLPTLKAFGQSAAYGRMLAARARALSDSTSWVLALNVLTRGFTDLGTAVGSAAALALGTWRVVHGQMSLEALLIVLMAGTEIFRPLRDLRAVLHQGLNGQAAAVGIRALLDTAVTGPGAVGGDVVGGGRFEVLAAHESSSGATPSEGPTEPRRGSAGRYAITAAAGRWRSVMVGAGRPSTPFAQSATQGVDGGPSPAMTVASGPAPVMAVTSGPSPARAVALGPSPARTAATGTSPATADGLAPSPAKTVAPWPTPAAADQRSGPTTIAPHQSASFAAGADFAASPTIDFDAVSFAYPGERQAAHRGLSFSISAGERLGIVGPSGAGKSTIVRLLLRLHDPSSGAVRIGGRDLRDLDPDAVRGMIAVVAQDTYLFHGSVEENLRLGRPDATPEELIAAATAANADGFIQALPQSYQTVIGERGTELSGGQRQRIAIARALLRGAPILVLDEALSSVDAENEAIIQQALDRLMQGRTTLILAHRLSSVIGADRILVLEDGAVVQQGTHRDMIAVPGPYRDLMRPQVAERADFTLDEDLASVLPAASEAQAAAPAGVPAQESLAADAARIGWPETLRTLLRAVRPYWGQLAVTVLTGTGRVVAFIGVSVLGALVLSAVRAQTPVTALVVGLLLVAPLAGVLHWLESWIAHAMAYALLAEMRIDLFRKLDALAPAYLLRRRSGDLVALATQDVETVEYFFAHTIAPAIVAVLVPAAVLVTLGVIAWPLALGLAPFLAYGGLSPVLGRQRIDELASAARGGLGAISAYTTETIQGLSEIVIFGAAGRRRDGFLHAVREYRALRLALLHDLSFQTAALEAATGIGSLAVAALGAVLVTHGGLGAGALPLVTLVSVAAFLPVSEIAQVGRQLADTIASTRRLAAVHAEPVTIVDGPLAPAARSGGSAVSFEDVSFSYPGRMAPAVSGLQFEMPAGATVALVGPSGAGKTTVANLLLRFWDPDRGSIRLDGVDLRQLTLDGLRGRIALVAHYR